MDSSFFNELSDFVAFSTKCLPSDNIIKPLKKFKQYLAKLLDKKSSDSDLYIQKMNFLRDSLTTILLANLDHLRNNDVSFINSAVLKVSDGISIPFGDIYRLMENEKKDEYETKFIKLLLLFANPSQKEDIERSCFDASSSSGEEIDVFKLVKDTVEDMKPIADELNQGDLPLKAKIRKVVNALNEESVLSKLENTVEKLENMTNSGKGLKLNRQLSRIMGMMGPMGGKK